METARHHGPTTTDDAAIHAAIDARVRAVRNRDVDALMGLYAADVATFDLVPPLASAGAGSVRKRVVEWFASFDAPIDYDVLDVRLAASGDVAFDHHLTRVRGTNRAGARVDMWFRETVGYQKRGGRWLVTHQHSSIPFDMTSGKPRLDLAP